MVLILCPGYEAAVDAYFEFIGVLRCCEHWDVIVNKWDHGLTVYTDSDLTYIFIDEAFQKMVEEDLKDETVDWDYMETFFDDIYNEDVPWYE